MLVIHNSATKEKELFKPIVPGKVSMYVCGMTVYDYCHIGHGRLFVVFDMVARYLRFAGYELNYVRNFTDVDDKIIKRAKENGEDANELAQRFIEATEEDEAALGVLPPDHRPRATHHVSDMIAMINTLMEKGLAYLAENGDVYYEVSKFEDYGKFSHQTLSNLHRGARVDILDDKHDPLDFVLWKSAKPGEPAWDSPWGKGRPGWHIECSAMIHRCMGKHIDIHGGGLDLVFPHHQNEVAQSEGAMGKPFVNTWMHLGYVQINKEKMSKSLNNFFTIREVLAQYHRETVRYFMLASHYRSPINYSHENLVSAKEALARLYISIRELDLPNNVSEEGESFAQQFIAAMDDDFNTPLAISVLFDLAREINRLRDGGAVMEARELGARLKALANVLGLLEEDPEAFLRSGVADDQVHKIEQLIAARDEARGNRQWAEADRLRDELSRMGVVIEDGAGATTWRLIN
ncbi:MAG: cysteinyl-tRNA synthetase [Gammaproteobacteria bacterium]|jgi:cysteinyl-tRNA synthetase|nr:cysteinyl-tRNA synthetase [Gammaproteobacteria bacterium]